MKLVVGNRYLKAFRFSSSHDALMFMGNQHAEKSLSIEDTVGDNYFCYVSYHSLTSKKEFVLSFSSDDPEDKLNFIFWDEHKKLVLDTGRLIYLIDENLVINASFDITSPLIGLYFVGKDKLLLMEEAFLRLIDYTGKILMSELFDLVEDFSIKNGLLSIQTSTENKVFQIE
jgi:hypothetical protein